MKTRALQKLRGKFAADLPAYGLWVTLESASITEMAVALGFDWVVIDAEHGHLDWKDILDHLRATVRSDTVALVRIAELNIALIKRVLDIGADGVVVPWMETEEQLRQAVAFAHYPPAGRRGIGGERATGWGRCIAQHVAEADEHVLVVPIIESVQGGKNIEALCRVPGVDIFFLGPADYSATAGYAGQWEGPGVAEQLLAIKDAVRRHGKRCGIMATSNANLAERRDQGFSMLGLGLDGGLLARTLIESLASVGCSRRIGTDLSPEPEGEPAATPLDVPPASIQPDRPETMNSVAQASRLEIAPSVTFQPLVGSHNQARNLTTGIVTIAPEGELVYHTHPFTEAVTVLEGQLIMEVEGRGYRLGPLDAVCIPAEVAHRVLNGFTDQPAVLHIAMASANPSRMLVDRSFSAHPMPDTALGRPGVERVHRHRQTTWYEASPGARFQDFFNRTLGCAQMSGGYGLFQPGARLPCHLHDFDESISIIEGTATCVVEGRRYQLSDKATALVPRGRCHYFINESHQPMAMIWVYAGPMPERLVLNEECCRSDRSGAKP